MWIYMAAEERQAKKETRERGRGREGEGNGVTMVNVFFMKSSVMYKEFTAIRKINGKEEKRLEKMF